MQPTNLNNLSYQIQSQYCVSSYAVVKNEQFRLKIDARGEKT